MGISFKVSKTGTRFRPKPVRPDTEEENDVALRANKDRNSVLPQNESNSASTGKLTGAVVQGSKDVTGVPDNEVSFALCLFLDGYSIGKPSENEYGHQASENVPKLLHPYDRASETLFSAIESGHLPGDILEDIPCKYVDGTLVCEVRDYRECFSEAGQNVPSATGCPIINRVCLKMSLENVVKDIPLISDSAWTYGDMMEVESRILRALQPQLCLDPAPKLDRICNNRATSKLTLGIGNLRRKRLRQLPDVIATSNDKNHGKNICMDRVPDSSRSGDAGLLLLQPAHENLNRQNNGPTNMLALRSNSFGSETSIPASPSVSHQSKYQMGVVSPRIMQDHRSGVLNASVASPAVPEMMLSYADAMSSGAASLHGKRENHDGQASNLSKRARFTHMSADSNQQQLIGGQIDGSHASDLHWKNPLLQQHSVPRGVPYPNTSMQKYPQQIFEGGNQEAGTMPFTAGQQGIKYNLKEEPAEIERLDKLEPGRTKNEMQVMESDMNLMESQQARLKQRLPQQFIRSGFPQTPWNGLGQPLDNNLRKEDPFQNRKIVQSPRVSAGGLPQSPLSSKSGEFSNGSVGAQYGSAVTSGLIQSMKEKQAATSIAPAGGTTSMTSSANDSMQRQHQAQIAAKRRSNSVPKTPGMSGVGSPASVSTMSLPINASSPPVGSTHSADQIMLDRFSKIEMLTARFQLNPKKSKVEEYSSRKPNVFPTQQLLLHLSNDSNNENVKDESCKMSLSKSLVGGSTNVCKRRILNFLQTEPVLQGNGVSYVSKVRTRMIMSEKPNDGTVAMYIGEIEEVEYTTAEDYLPTLPNTHFADLLAAQFCSLMVHEGYLVEDHVQPRPISMNRASSNQSNMPGMPPNGSVADLQQYSEGVSGQLSNELARPTNGINSSVNSPQNMQGQRMLPSGNAQALQISQGLLTGVSMPSRPQQSDPLSPLQQQQQQQQQNQHPLLQQQHPQLQRSQLMLASNPLAHLNTVGQNSMQLGNQMANKPSALQLQLLQQQQQQQQQQLPSQQSQSQHPQMPRKMMMGLGNVGNVGMGNISNNITALGGLSNVMGMGGVRGVGGPGISAPMGAISGMGNISQNTINMSQQASNISNAITQQLRNGALTPQQAIFMQTKLRMAQSRPQSNLGGITGNRQMHPSSTGLSILGSLNRANINPMQRPGIGPMAPPKLMTGMNLYMNPQQQQQQIQLQQQQMQQQHIQQQQQVQQQQQETASPLQAVVSPPPVGSPSNLAIPQQMNQSSQQPQQQQQQQHQQASPQQMSQRTPLSPQLSSGAIHPMSTGNPEACPASPQLSSQTLGSVGSITNSPMELQGVNKSNSINNA